MYLFNEPFSQRTLHVISENYERNLLTEMVFSKIAQK